ncbi:MAG TPA: FliH/SctL family protein [Bryobacteraceae bacterium]|nr:FliH/SctL family protein [Bryobacteraceae bacterium]
MSSRILSPGDAAEAAPIVWRRTGSPAQPDLRGRDAAKGGSAASEGGEQREREIEARVAAAREQGRAEAEQAAERRALDRLNPVFGSLETVVESLSGQRHRLRTEAEHDTVKLAITIARRILHREITADPDAIVGLVKAAFEKLDARETHRLRVAPCDAGLLSTYRAKLDFPPALEIASDASLSPGSAIFETSRGELDASIETQLGEIDRGLADLVRSGNVRADPVRGRVR